MCEALRNVGISADLSRQDNRIYLIMSILGGIKTIGRPADIPMYYIIKRI